MSKINIRESLRNMDADSCCKYDLLTMYDACPLTDEDKADIAKLLFDNEDPEVIYQKLCTYFCDDDVSELTGLTDVQNVTPFEAIINNVKTSLDQKYDGVFYNDVAGQFEITSKDTTYTFGLSPVEYETDGISLYVDYNYDIPINYTSIKEASEDILNKCIEKVSTASQSNGYVDDDTMEYTVYDVVEDEGRLCAKCMNESTNSFEDIKLGKVNSDAVNELLNNILNNPNYKLTNDCRKKIADNSAPWGIVMSPGFDITATNALMSTGDFGGSVSFGESEELTFENGDRVTDGNRKGTVIDCDSIKVLVEWDYSETDDIEWVDKSELSFVECLKESEIPMDTVKKDIQSYLNHHLGSNENYIEVNDVHNIDKDTVGVEYEVHLSIPIGNNEYERDTEYRSLPFRYEYGKWQPVVTESKYDIKTKTTARKLVDKAKADDIEWVMKEDLSFVNALKESENSPEVTYKQDRRLNSTSVIYKGYLIKIDRGGDGYNVYDKYRELEDTGFPSMEAAKKFVDELVTKDKMYESTTNTESYSTEQDLIDAGYRYVASNSPYDLYRKIIGGKGDWYAVNYENNTVQHITYAQARGYEPIDDTTGIKKLSMELGKKLLPQNESLGDTDCTESVHLGDGAEGPTKSGYQLNRKTGDYMDEVGKVFSNVKRKGKLITAINESTRMNESIVTDANNIGQGYTAPVMVSLVEKAEQLQKWVEKYKDSKDKDAFERFLPRVEDDILDYKSEIEENIKDFDKYWEVHKKAMLDNISEAVSILKNIGIPRLDSKLSKLNESYSDDEWIDKMWEAFQGISGIEDISEGKKPNTYIVTFDSEGSATARARILLKALIKADLDIELDSTNGSNVFIFTTPTNEWEFIKGKMVKDSDGFLTSYDWYRNTDSGLNIFMFGEEEADPDYADWETESDAEAEDWFNSYTGFDDEEELDESVGSSGTTEVISKELKDAAYKLFKTPKWGFESDKEIEDYINPIFDVSEDPKTGDIEVQVRAELGYNNLMDLSDVLDKVISKYDKDAYFEPEQPGILCAFIRY